MSAIDDYKRTRQLLFDKESIQPNSKYVITNGPVKNVHYLEIGRGKPLIIIHGGGSHSSEWIPVLKPLSEHFHLYVIDRPGCGLTDPFDYRGIDFRKSAVSFIKSFLDSIKLNKALFLGNSMGGYFSVVFAMEYPEKVTKLLLMGAPAGMNLWIPYMLRTLGLKGINKILLNTVAKPSVGNVKNIHKQILIADLSNLTNDYLEHCYYNQLLPGTMESFRTLLESVLNLRGWKKDLYIGDCLHKLRVPVRFIWGSKDAFELPATGRRKAESIVDHKFEIVEDAGHCPWLDKPEECVERVISMLQE